MRKHVVCWMQNLFRYISVSEKKWKTSYYSYMLLVLTELWNFHWNENFEHVAVVIIILLFTDVHFCAGICERKTSVFCDFGLVVLLRWTCEPVGRSWSRPGLPGIAGTRHVGRWGSTRPVRTRPLPFPLQCTSVRTRGAGTSRRSASWCVVAVRWLWPCCCRRTWHTFAGRVAGCRTLPSGRCSGSTARSRRCYDAARLASVHRPPSSTTYEERLRKLHLPTLKYRRINSTLL